MALFHSYLWLCSIFIYIPIFCPMCWWTFRLFPCLGYCNSAVMNIGVQESFWITVFSGYMYRIGISGQNTQSEWVKSLSRVRLFATPWTVAHQAHPSMGFSKQEYYIVHGILQARILEWAAFPFSRGSSQSRDEPRSPTVWADPLPAEPQGRPEYT